MATDANGLERAGTNGLHAADAVPAVGCCSARAWARDAPPPHAGQSKKRAPRRLSRPRWAREWVTAVSASSRQTPAVILWHWSQDGASRKCVRMRFPGIRSRASQRLRTTLPSRAHGIRNRNGRHWSGRTAAAAGTRGCRGSTVRAPPTGAAPGTRAWSDSAFPGPAELRPVSHGRSGQICRPSGPSRSARCCPWGCRS